jgi:hypothetical protein
VGCLGSSKPPFPPRGTPLPLGESALATHRVAPAADGQGLVEVADAPGRLVCLHCYPELLTIHRWCYVSVTVALCVAPTCAGHDALRGRVADGRAMTPFSGARPGVWKVGGGGLDGEDKLVNVVNMLHVVHNRAHVQHVQRYTTTPRMHHDLCARACARVASMVRARMIVPTERADRARGNGGTSWQDGRRVASA